MRAAAREFSVGETATPSGAPRRELRLRARLTQAVLLLAGLAWPLGARAEADDEDEVQDAGAPPAWALSGRPLDRAPPRPVGGPRACSARYPVCAIPAGKVPPRRALDALDAAERAWGALTGPLRIPPPERGPLATWDLYVVDGEEDATAWAEERDVRSTIDRAFGWGAVSARLAAGCSFDLAVARAVVEGARLGVAPSVDRATSLAQVDYLARLAVPCSTWDPADARTFQSQRERPLADPWIEEGGTGPGSAGRSYARGAGLFHGWLDYAYGATPGAIVRAMWALAPTRTPIGAGRWANEHDGFDVLEVTWKNTHKGKRDAVDDLWLDFAASRAFFGVAEDGWHFPEARSLGEAALVEPDWVVPWPSKPRRLAPRAPLGPLGAAYVVVKTEGAPRGARLRVELAWEEHARVRAALVRIDARGREMGRVAIAVANPKSTEAQMTLVDLDGVDRVLVALTNAGDPAYPFDPDDEVWEPHGWLLTLGEER